MTTTKTTLTLNVTFSGEDATPDVCRAQLEELVRFAAARGLLTGEMDMVVDDFDYTTVAATERRIMATFRPQDENCHYIHGAEREFDVTEQILAMGKDEALAIEDHTESADMLYHGQDEFEWDNPYEVEVEEAIRAYFEEEGN